MPHCSLMNLLSCFGLLFILISIIHLNQAKKKPTTPRPRTYGYCPPFYNIQCKDHCYINQTSNYTVTFQDAFDLCQSINASMPTIRSASDQRCLERYLSGTWHSVWLGLSIGDHPGKKRPSWQWTDPGVKYGTFTKWSSGEPRSSTPNDFRDCAEMSAVVGEWRATDCDTFRYGVLCEVPSIPFPDATTATTTGPLVETNGPNQDDDDDDTTTAATRETTSTTNATTTSSTTTISTSISTTPLLTTTLPPTTVANTSRATETTATAVVTSPLATPAAPTNTTKLSETLASNLTITTTSTPTSTTNVPVLINDAILDFITHALMITHRKNSNHTKTQPDKQAIAISNVTEANTTNSPSSTTPILNKASQNDASTTRTIPTSVLYTTLHSTLPTTTISIATLKAPEPMGNSFPFPTDLPVFEINPTPSPTTVTPPLTTITHGPNVQCFTMDKFYFTCRRGHLNISETNMELVSATTAIYSGDNSFDCRTVQYNLHRWILEQLGMRERRSMNDVVKIVCSKGSFDVSDFRPGMSDATTIEFTTNLSAKCMTYFTGFVEYMIRIYRSLQEAEKEDGE